MDGTEAAVALGAFGMIAYTIRGIFVLIGKRIEAKHAKPSIPPSDERLERIEQAVDAIALEVERISEGQRFTAKLLAEGQHRPNRSVGNSVES